VIGARYEAPWGGRYRVHRELAGEVVLADVGNGSAFVVVTPARLADVYTPIAGAELVAAAATGGADQCSLPRAPSWSPPRRPVVPTTLGADTPLPDRRMGCGGPPYWMRCATQFEGDTHVWFLSAGGQVLCPACRGVGVERQQRNPDPPPPTEAEKQAARAAGGRIELGAAWWRMVTGVDVSRGGGLPVGDSRAPLTQQGAATPGQGASLAAGNVAEPPLGPGNVPAPSARHLDLSAEADDEQLDQVVAAAPPARPEPACDDCGISPSRRPVVVLWPHANGLQFCTACLRLSPRLLELRTRQAEAGELPSGAWRPPPGETSAAKADVGSFDRPEPAASPLPKVTTARELTRAEQWAQVSAGFDR
jgi:hypothetical protein